MNTLQVIVVVVLSIVSGFQLASATPPERLVGSSVDRHFRQADTGAIDDRCDDATFLRRVSLDLIGRIPSFTERSKFLASPDRPTLVRQLLRSPEHAQFWSQLWTTLMIGRQQRQNVDRELFRAWMEKQVTENVPMDTVAFRIISASGTSTLHGPVNYVVANRDDQVLRLGRAFLGVQLDCAKCHDHPFDRWTNADYRSLAKFFEPLRVRQVAGGVLAEDVGSATQDPSDPPRFLTGREPVTTAWRRELAWMVVRCKPFSRAIVNRVWSWTMGDGLCEPVDAVGSDKGTSQFDALDSLAADFREHGHDLDRLLTSICLSRAYQQTLVPKGDAGRDAAAGVSARRSIRRLLPEQWIASVRVLTESEPYSPTKLSELTGRLVGQAESTLSSDPYDWEPGSQAMLRELSGQTPSFVASLDDVFHATLGRDATSAERALLASRSHDEILFVLIHSNEFLTNR